MLVLSTYFIFRVPSHTAHYGCSMLINLQVLNAVGISLEGNLLSSVGIGPRSSRLRAAGRGNNGLDANAQKALKEAQ